MSDSKTINLDEDMREIRKEVSSSLRWTLGIFMGGFLFLENQIGDINKSLDEVNKSVGQLSTEIRTLQTQIQLQQSVQDRRHR